MANFAAMITAEKKEEDDSPSDGKSHGEPPVPTNNYSGMIYADYWIVPKDGTCSTSCKSENDSGVTDWKVLFHVLVSETLLRVGLDVRALVHRNFPFRFHLPGRQVRADVALPLSMRAVIWSCTPRWWP